MIGSTYLLGRPGQPSAGEQRRLEGGRRLEGVDLQRIERLEPLVARIAPQQLGPLAFGEPQVGVGQAIENVGDRVGAERLRLAADQAIAQADQVVADVDGRRRAVLPVDRLFAVAEGVVVLDVVVNERGLVERLDRHGRPADRSR